MAYLRSRGYRAELFDPSRDYDVVVFQKAYDESHLVTADRLLANGTRLVLDLCDNHLYNPDGAPQLAARAERLRAMIERAHVVTVGTSTLASLVFVPDAVVVDDALEFPGEFPSLLRKMRRLRSTVARTRLVWFGAAGSQNLPFGMRDIAALVPVLGSVNRTHPISLTVVSNSRSAYRQGFAQASFPTRYVRWTPLAFEIAAAVTDVALLPVSRNPYTLGKTSNRVATALVRGLACVVSPLPSYEDFEGCVLFEDWQESIAKYAADPVGRAEDAAVGARRARELYAPDRIAGQWRTAIDRATSPG